MGDMSAFPEKMGQETDEAMYKTRNNTGLKLNIALNYGSRAEVVRACNTLIERGKPVDEADLMNALYTAGLPDLDLIIRTAGEQRLSNFMLLQAAYAELVFTDVTFPELTDEKYADCRNLFPNCVEATRAALQNRFSSAVMPGEILVLLLPYPMLTAKLSAESAAASRNNSTI